MGDDLPLPVNKSESCSDIPQFDGNISFASDISDSMSCDTDQSGWSIETVVSCDFSQKANISPPVWHEQYMQREDIPPVRRTVRRNGKLLQCLSLPIIAVSNVRSLLPKINSFKTDVLEREIGLSLLSEIWEVKGKKKHISEVTKMLEVEGLKYISTPRASNKRGGGCAIVAHLPKFSLEKIEVTIPSSVEVVYGLLRPKQPSTQLREIIVVAFYSPPKSRKKTQLIEHIISTCQSLLTKYPKAGIVIGGDRNEMSISPLLTGLPRLKQLVSKPTCNGKILDVLLTNLHEYYSVPEIVPPVPADNPVQGKPSDHSVPLAKPLNSAGVNMSNQYKTKISRPMPESGVKSFGQWIINENWDCVDPKSNPSIQASELQKLLETKLDKFFPTKSVRLSNKDKKWMDFELKKLDRTKKREWCRKGKSDKYVKLKQEFDSKFQEAAGKYLDKNVRALKDSDPGKAYATLKRMGAQPGDNLDEGSFTLLEHLEHNLTDKMSVDKIAEHFSRISREYPPLNTSELSKTVQNKLKHRLKSNLPFVSRYQVEKMMKKAKKTKSGVPGDMPKIIHQEFGPEIGIPLSAIYNNIVQTGNWPDTWKIEYGLPLKKTSQPTNEDDLRIISLTPFFSKLFEKFVLSWLLEYLEEHLDWAQYGGQKGNSVSHYLIDFINFVSYNQDIKNIHAVLAVAVDFSKAFNRQNHNILIELLSELGVPGWLLQIVIGFLEKREMEVFFKGEKSERKTLPGGGPQGTILGMFLFLILINAAGFKEKLRNTGEIITNPAVNKRKPIEKIHMKWIDDLTVAESVHLKQKLVENPSPVQPFQYHERTGHILPQENSKIQSLLNQLVSYTEKHQMRLNHDKTKVILFNRATKSDFFPQLKLENDVSLEVVEEIRLLGVQIRSDLSWKANTDSMCQSAYSRLWMLRRLKPLGASSHELLDVYDKQIRCMVEFAAPVWTSGLTKAEINQIERVQKAAFAIILGERYSSYTKALTFFKRTTLETRREDMNLKFGKKCLKSEKYKHWFAPNKPTVQNLKTRSVDNNVLKPVEARTDTFKKSPIAYLTNLINVDSST